MNNLFLDLNNTNEEIQENAVKKSVRQLIDREFKKELMHDLDLKHSIRKNTTRQETETKIFSLAWHKVVAASLIFVLASIFFFKNTSSFEMAQQYASTDIVKHPGLTKGVANNTMNITEAIKAFNEGNWIAAENLFEANASQDIASKYYQALACFYNKDYTKAISLMSDKKFKNSVFNQEVNWFLTLSYILSNNKKMAKEVVAGMKIEDWKYNEAFKMVK
jgi:hypothetical protein